MRASIQVSAQPSAPWESSPSAASTPIPNRVPSRWRETISASAGPSSAARSSSPVTATWRPSAWTNQSVPSAVLYSSVPVSAVFASMPSETVAAARRSTARAFVEPAGREEEALVRRHRVARPLAEPRVAGDRGRAGRRRDHELSAASTSCCATGSGRPSARDDVCRAGSRPLHDRGRPLEARRRTARPPPSPRARPPARARRRTSRPPTRPHGRRARGPPPRAQRTPRYHAPPGSQPAPATR